MKENEVGTVIVDCAVELHRELGPGLLETVYEVTLAWAIERRGLLMRDGITRTINGYLDSDPPCLRASVREEIIEPSAGATGHLPVVQP